MTYSSALFVAGLDGSLEQAQEAKYERMLAGARRRGRAPRPRDRLRLGRLRRVRGAHARLPRDRHHDLEGAARVRARAHPRRRASSTSWTCASSDYRDLRGQFDRIVSIEMIEAVGERWWPAYFRKLRECLKPGGARVHPVHHHRRGRLRALPRAQRLHPRVHLPRRHARPRGALSKRARARQGSRRTSPSASACTTPRRCAAGASAVDARSGEIRALGFDEQVPRPLALLPALLRGRVRRPAASTSMQLELERPA